MPTRDELIAALAKADRKEFPTWAATAGYYGAQADAVLALLAKEQMSYRAASALADFVLADAELRGDTSPAAHNDLQRLSDTATPGPWFYDGWHRSPLEETYGVWDGKPETRFPIIRTQRTGQGWNDAEFIVALVNAFRAGEIGPVQR
jgi:hypothetical protein